MASLSILNTYIESLDNDTEASDALFAVIEPSAPLKFPWEI